MTPTPDRRQLAVVCFAFAVVAVACTWPIAREATRRIPGDTGDPLLNAWALGWVADRLRHGLSGLWTAPNFFPYRNTLAFSEHLLGIAPFVAPFVWTTGNPLIAYNVAFVASFALAGTGMYVLAYDLTGGRRSAASVAGLAFALAPTRFAQLSHLQVLMSGWMPLALWALHRYLRTQSWRALAAFTAFVLVNGLSNSYFVYFLALPIAVVSVHGLAVHRDRRLRLVSGLAAAAAVVLVVMAPIALVYFDVRRDYGFHRTEQDVVNFGADLGGYLRGNDGVPHLFEPWRRLPNAVKPVGPEGQLFPGLAALLLAGLGVAAAWRRRNTEFRTGRVYTVILVTAVWLSMGPWPTAWGVRLPVGGVYALLFRHLPGFDGIRVPARLSVVALIAIDVLAALGVASIERRLSRRAALATTAALLVVVMLEGVPAPLPTAFVGPHGRPERTLYNWVRDREEAAVLEMPVGVVADLLQPFRYQYQTLFHQHRIVNGSSGYDSALDGFVSGPASPLLNSSEFADALRMLRDLGVRTIVVHPREFTDRDAEADAMRNLRAARDQVLRETPIADSVVFTLAPVSDAERQNAPGGRAAAGRLATGTREVPAAALTADSALSRDRLPYLFDHDLDSRWLSGGRQTGTEWVDIVLDRPRDIAMLTIETSARSAGDYPRHLVVESTGEAGGAKVLFDGSVLVALGRGVVADPIRQPIQLWLPSNRTRRLRLRQTAETRTWLWAIDELRVFEAS